MIVETLGSCGSQRWLKTKVWLLAVLKPVAMPQKDSLPSHLFTVEK